MSKSVDSVKRAAEDNSEYVIDKFVELFLSSDVAQIVSDFPVITTVQGIAAGIYNLRNWRVARNISYFIQSLQIDESNQEDYENLVKKYGRSKILENVLLSLEAMRSEKQAVALACLFSSLVTGSLNWKRFSELQNILEKIDISALEDDFNGKEPSYKLLTVGLAYLQTVYDGVKLQPNGKLYTDFENYIVKPYHVKLTKPSKL